MYTHRQQALARICSRLVSEAIAYTYIHLCPPLWLQTLARGRLARKLLPFVKASMTLLSQQRQVPPVSATRGSKYNIL